MKSKNNRLRLMLWISIMVSLALVLTSCQTGELSRTQAKSLIETSPGFKQPTTIKLMQGGIGNTKKGLLSVADVRETPEQAVKRAIVEYGEVYPDIGLAFHFGLVEPQVSAEETSAPPQTVFYVPASWHINQQYAANEKGKQLWRDYKLEPMPDSIPTAQREIVEITGIAKHTETQTMVDFTYRWVPNNIGKYQDSSTEEFKSLPAELREGLEGKPMRMTGWSRQAALADWQSVRKARMSFQKFDDGWRPSGGALYQ